MTHDELLAICDNYSFKNSAEPIQALRAVAELHKPVMKWTGAYDYNDAELWEEQCNDCSNNGFSQMYPCPTIQVIEKELA